MHNYEYKKRRRSGEENTGTNCAASLGDLQYKVCYLLLGFEKMKRICAKKRTWCSVYGETLVFTGTKQQS